MFFVSAQSLYGISILHAISCSSHSLRNSRCQWDFVKVRSKPWRPPHRRYIFVAVFAQLPPGRASSARDGRDNLLLNQISVFRRSASHFSPILPSSKLSWSRTDTSLPIPASFKYFAAKLVSCPEADAIENTVVSRVASLERCQRNVGNLRQAVLRSITSRVRFG